MMKDRLTLSSLLHLLRHNQKDSKYLNHYLHHDVLHSICRRHLGIFFEPSEEILNSIEDINERILARSNILYRLCWFSIRKFQVWGDPKQSTERRTPAPAKITFAGENT